MTISIQQYWPPQDLSAVCNLQNGTANVPLVLNGSLKDPLLINQLSFVNSGFIRSCSITSTSNLSAATIIIRGYQNGVTVQESFTGPNNNTVYGLVAFDVITSVTSNVDVANIRVGTGDIGYLPLIGIDNLQAFPPSWALGCYLPSNPATGLTFSAYTIIENITYPNTPFDDMKANGQLYNALFSDVTASQHVSVYETTGRAILINITASTHPNTDSMRVTFLQSGV